jgi:UDP-N-acetylmuramate--alanine ligase
MFSKAYVGCDHRSAAISMDKALSKRLVMDKGLPALPFISFSRHEWKTCQEQIKEQIGIKLTYPLFVKPVHLGSTVGVHKVKDPGQLDDAIADSFRYDTHLIVENGLENPREIEFSLLGNDDPMVFPPGEVLAAGNVHDFDSKYGLNPAKPAADYKTIASLPEEKVKEGMELALASYQAVGGVGMARVDTFLDASGKFWFNEINPIPGFTKYSLYHLMCAAHGLPLTELIDALVVFGLQRRRELDRLQSKRDAGQ